MTSPDTRPAGHENNRRTVQAYEGYARRYAEVVAKEPSGIAAESLARFAGGVGAGGRVLEIGSGPGWDADHLERGGLSVRRTDVTETFRTFQAELGRQIEALDVLTDELGGPYDGVLMLYVLQHLAADATQPVFDKVAGALRPGGWFLLSFREGEAEIWEGGSRDYWVVERRWPVVAAQLREAGLVPAWDTPNTDSDGAWRIVLAQRAA